MVNVDPYANLYITVFFFFLSNLYITVCKKQKTELSESTRKNKRNYYPRIRKQIKGREGNCLVDYPFLIIFF